MYQITRAFLRLTVLLGVYLATVTLVTFPQLVPVVGGLLIVGRIKRAHRHTAHGTARWAAPDDVPHLLDGDGLIVGHLDGKLSRSRAVGGLFGRRLPARVACQRFLAALNQRRRPTLLVRLTNAVHTAVFAPTGAGKGVSGVVPFLMTCPDPMVVVDPKGENYLVTRENRRKMGHRIVVVDPYKVVTQTPDTFNPVEFVDPAARTALDDCRDMAEMLVVRNGQEKEPHWADSAEVWIAAMLAVVVTFADGPERSLQSARALLTDPAKMAAAIKLMTESDAMEGMLSRLGHQLGQFKDRELASTLTTTNRFLRFLDTGPIADSTRRSTFNPADLLKGRVTVFLVLPPDRMRAQAALLRLWIGSMLRAVIKGGLQSERRVQFVLDEAAMLGHMESIDDAINAARGYGARMTFLFQSLGQLRLNFPDGQDQTFLSNVTQVFFGTNDPQTAEYVSSRLGEGTIVVGSGGTSTSTTSQSSAQGGGGGTSRSTSSNDNWQLMGRKLLRPEEVAALPDRVAITFAPGAPPMATRLVRYYERGALRGLRGPGPFLSLVRAACLLVATAALAALFTAALADHGHERDRRRFPPAVGDTAMRVKRFPADRQ